MARPTRDESRLLECLENTAAGLHAACFLADVLRVRMRQVERRVGGHHDLIRVVQPASDQLAELEDEMHAARSRLEQALDLFQQQRTRKHTRTRG